MQFVNLLAALTLIVSLTASSALAGQTGCPEHFAGGQSPDLINQKLTAKTREVCYSGYTPFPEEVITCYKVPDLVNNPRFDSPACIVRV